VGPGPVNAVIAGPGKRLWQSMLLSFTGTQNGLPRFARNDGGGRATDIETFLCSVGRAVSSSRPSIKTRRAECVNND